MTRNVERGESILEKFQTRSHLPCPHCFEFPEEPQPPKASTRFRDDLSNKQDGEGYVLSEGNSNTIFMMRVHIPDLQ
jgi:hypothetical protein